jgi:capsid portal protein
MSSESPPAKRQRTDEDEPITRSDIWYEDGSVVLQARNTQFRVHWGVLAQHSSFFRDMQKLPQPPDQPNADGCPIVELQDEVADVEHLLRALYSSFVPPP